MSNHKLDKKGKRLREAIPREAMFLTFKLADGAG
jgi:hypothetical protein